MIDWAMDESGDPNQKILVVSAVMGQTSCMKKLTRRWLIDLDRYGVDYFHARKHWNQSAGCYHRISARKRRELLTGLSANIGKYCIASFGAEINIEEFEKNASQRFKNTFGSAYAYGVNLLLIMTRVFLSLTGDTHQDINILIEDGHKNANQAIEQISTWKRKPGAVLKISSYGLGDKKSHPILQAADLVAYGWWQFKAGTDPRMFSALRAGAPKLAAMFLPWDNSSIEAIKRDVEMQQSIRDQGLSSKKFRDLALW
jgi:hypothetical protein